jgi:hypothetical protein
MNIRCRSPLAMTFALLLALGTSSLALADCPGGKTHELKFKVKSDGCVEKVQKNANDSDADDTHVCPTDSVIWKVSGPKKAVVFEGDSPFDWVDSGNEGNKIVGVVRSDAAKNGQRTEYKYSVKVEGQTCVYDPKIIVDP